MSAAPSPSPAPRAAPRQRPGLRATFAGVGEAVDERLPNTSILLAAHGCGLLLDCGFTAAHTLFRAAPDAASTLGGVWLSHFHGDHWFGLPALLVRLMTEKRSAPLALIGLPGIEEKVRGLTAMAYRSVLDRLPFALRFFEAEPGADVALGPFNLTFARAGHPSPALAVRVATSDGASCFYSGDGRPTDESLALARDAGLVIHEAFCFEGEIEGHGSVASACAFAAQARARALALVHVRREERFDRAADIRAALDAFGRAAGIRAFLPEPGESFEVKP